MADLSPVVLESRSKFSGVKGEPANLSVAWKRIKDLDRFPFEEAGGHWIKTADGSWLHAWSEPALNADGSIKVFGRSEAHHRVVIATGLTGRSADTYRSGMVDAIRTQGLSVAFVEGNGDGWTILRRLWDIRHGLAQPLPDRWSFEDQARNFVEAAQGLEAIERAKGQLSGSILVHMAGNSYGGWKAQAVAASELGHYFRTHILLGTGGESLHRSAPLVRETEDMIACMAATDICPAGSFNVAMAFFNTFINTFVRTSADQYQNQSAEKMERAMFRSLPGFFREHFPLLARDEVRLQEAVRKFAGFWRLDTKKHVERMHNVINIMAQNDSIMPAQDGITLQHDLALALNRSQGFLGNVMLRQADHDFWASGLENPELNLTARLIAHAVRRTGPIPIIRDSGQIMVIDDLTDMKPRPARPDEIHTRPPAESFVTTMLFTLFRQALKNGEKAFEDFLGAYQRALNLSFGLDTVPPRRPAPSGRH